MVSLNVEDVETRGDTLRLNGSANFPDPKVGLAGVGSSEKEFDPTLAFARWLEVADIATGPLFRAIDRHGNIGGRMTGRTVYNIVRKYADAAGIKSFSPTNFLRFYSKSGIR